MPLHMLQRKGGWQNLSAADRALRMTPVLVTVATPEMVNKVHDIVMTDRQLTERYIASTVGISQERVHSILTEDLEMKKLLARWVPRLLTVD